MSNIRPEALKNITDAVWTILRQQGDDPEVDLQALALCVITALAALKPEHRAPYYLKFTQVLREQAAPLLSDEQDPGEWLDRESRVH